MNVGGIQKALSRHLFLLAGVCALVFLGAPKARAQTTTTNNNDTLCQNNVCGDLQVPGVTILTSSNLPTLELGTSGAETGQAYLVVLVPSTSDLQLSFSVNGNLATDNGLWSTSSSSTNIYAELGLTATSPQFAGDFSSFQNASDQVASTTSFNVYTVLINSTYNSGTSGSGDITFSGISSLPPGTVFWAYVTSSGTTVIDTVDGPETVTITPEPATLGLIGSGLLLIGLVIRRREVGKS